MLRARAGSVLFILCLCCFHGCVRAFTSTWTPCADEAGAGSLAHEHFLDRLNGRRIVFVGDSLSRYQYLELAYYAVYGLCPDEHDPEYILSEASFNSDWTRFYHESSQLLTSNNSTFQTTETCFCSRSWLQPGSVNEQRVFQYSDVEVRTRAARGRTHAYVNN